MNDRLLSLTADEVMVLCDRTLNTDRGTEDMPVTSYSLLLRLGSAYVDMLGDGKREGELSVAVTESEAWLLRSKITSGDKSSSDSLFGVKLLTKIYRLILAYNDETPEMPLADTDGEQLTEDMKRALKRRAGGAP
jgi:hypothetical protein